MCSFLICKMGKTLKSTPNDPSPHPMAMLAQMFSKIDVLKNFAIFTGKYPC